MEAVIDFENAYARVSLFVNVHEEVLIRQTMRPPLLVVGPGISLRQAFH